MDRVELVGFGKGHPEEAPGKPIPERRVAGLVHHSAKLGQCAVAEARPVEFHEQIAAAREQRSETAGAHLRVEEQPADLGRAFEVGGEGHHLVAEGLAKLRAGLGERADVIAVKGLGDPDLPEDLAGAADLPGFRIVEHEHVQVPALAVFLARE